MVQGDKINTQEYEAMNSIDKKRNSILSSLGMDLDMEDEVGESLDFSEFSQNVGSRDRPSFYEELAGMLEYNTPVRFSGIVRRAIQENNQVILSFLEEGENRDLRQLRLYFNKRNSQKREGAFALKLAHVKGVPFICKVRREKEE